MIRKISGLFFIIYFCFSYCVQGQKVQYSRQTIQNPNANSMHLVGNIRGFHHLLFFTANKHPVVYIFDSKLQLYSKKEIDIKINGNSDIRLVRFQDYYYLYVHVVNSNAHDMFKIDGEGKVTSISKNLQVLVDSE